MSHSGTVAGQAKLLRTLLLDRFGRCPANLSNTHDFPHCFWLICGCFLFFIIEGYTKMCRYLFSVLYMKSFQHFRKQILGSRLVWTWIHLSGLCESLRRVRRDIWTIGGRLNIEKSFNTKNAKLRHEGHKVLIPHDFFVFSVSSLWVLCV